MASKKEPLHYIHFVCNGVAGFVEVEKGGDKYVVFAGKRIAYGCMQGKLKNTVHSVMVQHHLISSWRG